MLMREKEENIVFFYDKKNDIKLNVFVWFVNFELWMGGDWLIIIY